MRKISVDIFYCKREHVKQAILEYLENIRKYDGMQCPNIIMLGGSPVTIADTESMPVYRLFSIQRRRGMNECKIVVNVSRLVVIHKQQRVRSYISGNGIEVYEREQYNSQTKDWYIVGDSSTRQDLITAQVDLHNEKLAYTTKG